MRFCSVEELTWTPQLLEYPSAGEILGDFLLFLAVSLVQFILESFEQ